MLERLRQQIDVLHQSEVRRSTPVMTPAERDKRLAELDAELLALERHEEFLIDCGEQYSFFVARRENANPLAVLGPCTRKSARWRELGAALSQERLRHPACSTAGRRPVGGVRDHKTTPTAGGRLYPPARPAFRRGFSAGPAPE